MGPDYRTWRVGGFQRAVKPLALPPWEDWRYLRRCVPCPAPYGEVASLAAIRETFRVTRPVWRMPQV